MTEQGGLDHWQNCKEENKTAVRLAQESTKNKHQINLYPIKVSNCIGQTSWSKIVAGLDWVMSRPIEKEGVIDVPVSSDGWSGKQSVTQAIDSLTSLGFAIVDRRNSDRRYYAEGVTAEPVSKPISESLKMLKKKKKRALEQRQKHKNQNNLGSLSTRIRDSAKANRLAIDPDFNPPLASILAFTPMILDCVPRFNTSAAIFHGCYYWHSSVHGNWALLWASRVSGDPSLRDGIFNRYTEGNVSRELSRVLPFEHTYGFAWFLDLAHEAELLGNTALRPLADYFYSELLATLDINALPTVGDGGNPTPTALLGSYDNDAWAVFQTYQWAEYINDTVAQNMLIERVSIHYQNVDWSRAYTDFFDAKFLAAMMMVKMNITGPAWDNLMTAISQDSLSVPQTGSSHCEGVVSARAWGLWALYARTGSTTYLDAYNAHVASNLSRASYWSQGYRNSHWLGQFAIFALQLPEILPASGNPINFAPTVNAGPDQATTLPNVATLSASVTDDGLPNAPSTVTTQWSVVSGPGAVTFDNATAVSTTASFSVAGNYVLQLSADDGDLVTTDQLQMFVSTVVAPELEPAQDSDGDGVPDTLDAFPNDNAEQFDSDGDGTGDNADAFPNDHTETADSDGDGTGDNADVYPNDPTRIDDDPVEFDGLSKILNSSRWSLISIPADPSDNGTLERLFGDDLPVERYGPASQWVVYSYDAGIGQYRVPELSETLQANTAYWIFQQLGEPVEIDLPANQPTLLGSAVSGCIADRQCVTVQLRSNGSSATWNLVGYSSSNQVRFGDTRLMTSSGVCANGCTPAEARAANVASDVLFRLNSAGDGYELVTEDTPLLPWDGYWLMTMAGIDQPRWVMPVDSE